MSWAERAAPGTGLKRLEVHLLAGRESLRTVRMYKGKLGSPQGKQAQGVQLDGWVIYLCAPTGIWSHREVTAEVGKNVPDSVGPISIWDRRSAAKCQGPTMGYLDPPIPFLPGMYQQGSPPFLLLRVGYPREQARECEPNCEDGESLKDCKQRNGGCISFVSLLLPALLGCSSSHSNSSLD